MAEMNVSKFISNFAKGGAKPNLFKVTGTFPEGIGSPSPQDATEFFVRAASIPASTLGTVEVPFRGRMVKLAGDRTFETWNITILNSADYDLRMMFEKWNNAINGYEENVASSGLATGNNIDLSLYAKDWRIHQLDKTGEIVSTYVMHYAWPKVVGAITLDFEQTDQIETFEVQLEYTYHTIEAPISIK